MVLRVAESGGVLKVDVGPNDREITIVNMATGETTRHAVAPGKTTSIPVPQAPSGTAFQARIGTGRSSRIEVFEIIGTGP